MRKLLAVLLAAIMLVGALAVLPVGAEDTDPAKSKFDGTTSDETMDLIITEIVADSATGVPQVDEEEGKTQNPDAFDYIEIYNAGNSAVNLYDYKLLMADGTLFSNEKQQAKGKFSHSVDLAGGNPFGRTGARYGTYDGFNNPTTASLAPGQFAVIWFYTFDTTRLSDYYNTTKRVDLNCFKEHYGMASDSLVVAVCGEGAFKLDHNGIYALAYDSFDASKLAVTNAFGKDQDGNSANASLNEDIVCMARMVRGMSPFSQYATNVEVWGANYVPSSATPDFVNANNEYAAEEGDTPKVYGDYVQELNHAASYREVAAAATSEAPTPGKMPAWQWAYVDPDRLEAAAGDDNADMAKLVSDWGTNTAIKKDNALNTTAQNGESAWISAAINANIAAIQQNIDSDGRADSTEQKIDYSKNFVDRAELERRHGLNKKQSTNEKKGLPIWALILIIAGGVVLVGGIAVVVIIIVKKKNRPVAADDVAAEGEIEIVDETAANEAPVEDTPVEEDKE